MATKTVIGARVEVDGLVQAEESVKSFRQQLREATNNLIGISEKFGVTSKEAANAAKKVADLRFAMKEAKELSDTFNPAAKFVALRGALEGVTAGFETANGIMGAFGAEGKDVEEMLLKVQSAMALQQGISGIVASKEAFSLMATEITEKVVAAFSTLKGAIIATGLGALAVAIGYVISNFDSLKESLFGVNDAEEALKKTNDAYADAVSEAQSKIDRVTAAFDEAKKGVISQKDALKLYNDELGDAMGKQTSLTGAEQNMIDKAPAYIKVMGLKARANALYAQSAQMDKDIIEAGDQNNSSVFSHLTDYLTGNNVASSVSQVQGTDSVVKRKTKQKDELLKLAEDYNIEAEKIAKEAGLKTGKIEIEGQKSIVDELKKLRDELLEHDLNAYDLEVHKLQEKYDKMRDIAKNHKKDLELIEVQYQNDLVLIDEKYRLRTPVDEIQRQEIQLTKDISFQKRQIIADEQLANEHASQANRGIAQANVAAKEAEIGAIGDLVSTFSVKMGQQSVAGKALAIASATIDTYRAANSALKADYGVFGPVAQIARFVSVAATIAVGIKNVKEIAKVQVPGSGGGSAPGISAPITPSIPQAIQTNTTLDQSTINQIGNSAVRAFVVESDVSGNQERIRRLNRAARIN